MISDGLHVIQQHPLGIGLTAQLRSETWAQVIEQNGWLKITSDAFFVSLFLNGGILLASSFIFLLLFPLLVSYRIRKRINAEDRELFWAIWAVLLVGVFFGGISNSALLNGTPSNLLVWASMGVLFKMFVWGKTPPTHVSKAFAKKEV